MEPLDVVFESAKTRSDFPLDNVLRRLGYRSRFLTPEAWARQVSPVPHKPSILVMGARPGERLMSTLRCWANGPILGVFPGDHGHWDDELLDYLDDFMRWPCHEQELGLRLNRLCCGGEIQPPLSEAPAEEFQQFDLIGRSPAFVAALGLIRNVSRCDAPVLISGETGTGKELCARAIHCLGARHKAPFIAVNCGSIPDNLIENELFGHDRGAFTDAKQANPGMVELAQGGTLFLDEIDSLSDKAQVALLRFAQNQEYRPLGSREIRQGDVRIVAATNADLGELVATGEFREDLLYRLNVLPIRMPPLRERGDDIMLIVRHVLRRFSVRYNQPEKQLHPDSLAWMQSYSWPGNVRELENLLQRGLLLSDGPLIRLEGPCDMPCDTVCGAEQSCRVDTFRGMEFNEAKARAVAHFERSYLHWLMAESSGNVSEAARRAGKERRALGKLIKKYRIDRHKYA